MTTKRHHYVSHVYLAPFCDAEGKIYVYRKDNPDKPIHQTPGNVGFHKYYYSQPLPDGGKDHDSLETFFSVLEGKWPLLVERIRRREVVSDALPDLFEFVALQRARVPASRDAAEKLNAEVIKATIHFLDDLGKLPPKPEGHEDILDNIDVTIDPHVSIHAIPTFVRAMGNVFNRMGFGILHNTTGTPFITSDNPVVYFDPKLPEKDMRPYTLKREDGDVLLYFPIGPKLMLYGDSLIREPFTQYGLRHAELRDVEMVESMNRMICRFAYKAIFSQSPYNTELVREFADLSPVIKTTVIPTAGGRFILQQSVFGKREPKPKWDGAD